MASMSVSRTVPASPDKVWSLIGGFDALPDWLPYIPESTALEGGRVRRLTNPDGEVITGIYADGLDALPSPPETLTPVGRLTLT